MIIWVKKTIILLLFIYAGINTNAQGNISFTCAALNLSKSATLKCDPISEDDPDDLAEAYSYLVTNFHSGNQSNNQGFELRFPARTGNYHWTQQSNDDKNDSLSAYLYYNMDPNGDKTIQAYAKDFTINIKQYDGIKGGIIEGTFTGTLAANTAWNNQTAIITVKGNFRTTRTGKPGDECRKQRLSEKIVIAKAVNVFNENLVSPLQSMGWQITNEETGLNSQIANGTPSPYRPMMLCSDFFHLKLTVDPNSAYGKMLQDSAEYYSKQSSLQATKNMFRILKMKNIEIKIEENDPYLQQPDGLTSKGIFTVMHIDGPSYAYRSYEPATSELDMPKESTVLFFGDWKGANMNAQDYVAYPFTHKKHAAVIENFAVIINAPEAVADVIIKKINWGKLNIALSK